MKLLKIISFLPFLTLIGQNFGPRRPSSVTFLAIFAFNFQSGVFTTTTFCFKRYYPCKIWKETFDNACFFTFFLTLGLIWPKFSPKTTPTLIFFTGFQWNILGDLISINNFNWNPVVLKKLLKYLKITIFWPNLCKNGFLMGYAPPKKQFFLHE